MLPTVVIAALLLMAFHSFAMASPVRHCDKLKMNHERMEPEKASPEIMREHMRTRLDRLAMRLEINSAQQSVWGEFAASVEMLAERNMKKPDDADAAAILHFQAARASEFARKLSEVANSTEKLQSALTEDQRTILKQEVHRLLNRMHEHMGNRMDQRENCDVNNHHDVMMRIPAKTVSNIL